MSDGFFSQALHALRCACSTPSCARGCTETLAPREPFDEELSVYGLLTPDRDTQSVWVFPIEELPTLGTPDALEDVTVRSRDLETNESIVWQDTVVQRANGQYEYLYRAPFRPAYGRTYRVEVQRLSEEPVWADVRVPPRTNVEIVSAGGNRVTVDVEGENIQVHKTEVEYHVRASLANSDTSYFRQYWGSETPTASGFRISIRFNIDRYWVERWYFADFHDEVFFGLCPQLLLGDMRLHVLVGDAAWSVPGPAFDPYVLSQPGTIQNVENGNGFIGGGYRIDVDLDVPRQAVEEACFIYCESPFYGCEDE